MNQRRQWGLLPIDDEAIAPQQKIADTFYDLEIIPKAIQIQDTVLLQYKYLEDFLFYCVTAN